MTKEHLIPQPIIDLGERALMEEIPHHQREVYIQRLEEVLAYCERVVFRAKEKQGKKK